MMGMSQFILLKGLQFVTAINAIIAFSLQKSKIDPWKVPEQNVTFAAVPRWVPGQISQLSRRSRRIRNFDC